MPGPGARYLAPMDAEAITACAALVERGDPDRFHAVLAAPVSARGALLVLYAFNLELARAPWVTREPLIARMRLQFWRDVVTGDSPAAHEVAAPLRELIRARGLSVALLEAMIDAREAEIGTSAPFADAEALWRYLEGTAGALMAAGVQALGGPVSDAARAYGAAQGLANYLLAVPALVAAGRQPLPDGGAPAIVGLARDGLSRIAASRRDLRRLPRAARPALLAGWRAEALLRQAAGDPGRVGDGRLGQSEFMRRGSLFWAFLRGV